ncbi:NAD(P)H-binding protein [Kitasatospora phosalacinea]|uniref:Nucleotide-diphosphate-sugar epimerase n=1 Tax=Kitasatospora phosalacinea TaxID=2065 RepID=A0A9W6PKU4_9ACTN|nr:NAD(P)H-binding protein [Kitasatospora phosalacinea]GLW56845.1 nucleotide-diphosphate-sugar epimerase [Kitasatospora phosalacinea]
MIMVTGATGTVGREVVRLLAARGDAVAAVTRDPAAAFPAGVRRVVGDPSRPRSLDGELAGVRALLLSPRAVGAAAADLLASAAGHGVRRVVVLSAVTVEYGGGYRRFAAEFERVEAATRDSGLSWTFLRCADFAANSLAWAPQVRATGTARGVHGAAATSPVHERDVAEAAVLALRDEAHAGRAYPLTGPQSLTQYERARLIGAALGREVPFEEVPPEALRRALLAQGLPADVPDRLIGYAAACLAAPGPTTDALPRLLGRPARTFAAWAAEHASAFA